MAVRFRLGLDAALSDTGRIQTEKFSPMPALPFSSADTNSVIIFSPFYSLPMRHQMFYDLNSYSAF